MCINLSAKFYQENKERLQQEACERYQKRSIWLQCYMVVSSNMVVNVTKISQKMKKINW